MAKVNVLIVGGGTGGHISPGIALYEECKKRDINAFLMVGKKDQKFKYLREVDPDNLLFIDAPGLSKNPLKWPKFLYKYIMAVLKTKSFIVKNDITRVIGMGGYVSAPALTAAKMIGTRIFLCEQNSVPGKVTKSFMASALKIFTTFESSKKFINQNYLYKIQLTGNPLRKKIYSDLDKSQAKKFFNLQHCDKVILVIGGSQGAVSLNEFIVILKNKHSDDFKNIGIIWCTGAYSYEKYKKIVQDNHNMGSIYISPFVEDVGKAYAASDIVIGRSGAGVMMEVAAVGLPSLLVPYPFSAANHQEFNADEFVEGGAAIKIGNKELLEENAVDSFINLINNKQRLNKMSKNALNLSKPNAAKMIIDIISNEGVYFV